jgi:hypothetical protein
MCSISLKQFDSLKQLDSLKQSDNLKQSDSSLSLIRRGFAPGFVNYKKGTLDSQPQVMKFTSCLLVVLLNQYDSLKQY